MRLRYRELFATIRTEGAILPPDLIRRVADADPELGGLTPADYHLPEGEKLNEAINRSWNRLLGFWEGLSAARARLQQNDAATGITRDKWLLPLFQELGYGRLAAGRALEINGRTYPVSHGWLNSPIHLVGCGVDLDTRTSGVAGAARISPHGLIQELLNRSDAHLWGFVSNGLKLRILRDNASLTRQAYVEFDLEGMMTGEVYADFAVLWLLCHQSRVEGDRAEDCWLEKWSHAAQEQGARALDQLRNGVEKALVAFGAGFIKHPANADLRDDLRRGTLDAMDYYRQLLRLIYRMIFLFVAEDRGLLIAPDAGTESRRRYLAYYSTSRLRRLAIRLRGSRHADLYEAFVLVMRKLGSDEGCPELALPALGSFLFSDQAIHDLQDCRLSNRSFLEAIRALSIVDDGRAQRLVDFKNIGSEEFGSVYESLLELHPELHLEAGRFRLKITSGSVRKTSGSYYTPTSLINCLLDTALEPVIAEALKKPNPEQALLNLKVCDPACGSGHFLIAAAHRIAKRLASTRTGEDEPSPDATRSALRAVIGHCIYGVDINDMAVELCKVALWMEALDPGKPLSFLDHKIQCGNSLLGTTPALIEAGIPDEAFTAIAGDEKSFVSSLKRLNKQQRAGQMDLPLVAEDSPSYGQISSAIAELDRLDDSSVRGIRQKQDRYRRIANSAEYLKAKLIADAWCAAFVWKKKKTAPPAVTHDTLRSLQSNPTQVEQTTREEIERLTDQYGFIHWHLAFPDVFKIPDTLQEAQNLQAGWDGGFDAVLGNPPWERIKLQEKEWFSSRRPDIAEAPNAAARRRMINKLSDEDPALYDAFLEDSRRAEATSHLVRNSGRYPLCGRGDVNTYAIFAETKRMLISPTGRVGTIVPSGIATDDTTKYFFQDLSEKHSLASLYDFENREGIFPAVHRSFKFCLLTLAGSARPENAAEFAFFAYRVEDLFEEDRRFTLSAEDIALLNPNTRTCPIFRSRRDAELTKAIYRRVPVLIKEGPPEENPWGIKFSAMFHMSNDSDRFRAREQLESDGWILEGNIFRKEGAQYLPLYEAKMIHHFDHRWATYDGPNTRDLTLSEKQDPDYCVQPRYWVKARDVYIRVADLPGAMLTALRQDDSEPIMLALAHLLFSDWLQKTFNGSVGLAMQGLFPAWKEFVDYHPFAIDITPIAFGLCGNNPARPSPLGPHFLPAQPLDKITNTDRSKAAWYEADRGCVEACLNYSTPYLGNFGSIPALENEDDAQAFLDDLLKKSSPAWLLGWRDICRNTDERTVIASAIPTTAAGNNLPLIILPQSKGRYACAFLSCLSSFVLDFAARFKVGGTHLNFFIINQIPVVSPSYLTNPTPWDITHAMYQWILPRTIELFYTASDAEGLAQDCAFISPPFCWDEDRRTLIRCELDAAFLHIYLPSTPDGQWKQASKDEGAQFDESTADLLQLKKHFPTPRHAVDYIMDTFPIVRRNDENRFSEYRTKRVILEIYDAMQESIRTGRPYVTRLDPPPGPPAEGLPEWEPGSPRPVNWPLHIHPPKNCNE